jgi:hypothetical protein
MLRLWAHKTPFGKMAHAHGSVNEAKSKLNHLFHYAIFVPLCHILLISQKNVCQFCAKNSSTGSKAKAPQNGLIKIPDLFKRLDKDPN